MSISTDYKKNLNGAVREALADTVAAKPSTTVSELRELIAAYPELAEMTLGQLVQPRGTGKPMTMKREVGAGVAKAVGKALSKRAVITEPDGGWNTRTIEGREHLDRAVIDGLRALGAAKDEVNAESLRASIPGATPAQIRESLNRAIGEGYVEFSGKARGTKYSLTATAP